MNKTISITMNGLFGGKGSIVPMGLWFYLFSLAMNRWAIVMYAPLGRQD